MSSLENALKKNQWFHSIEFDYNKISKGRFDENRPTNYTLYGVLYLINQIDISNKSCLDMGTMDGLIAFSLAEKGANVIATDLAFRENFLLGKEFLNYQIEYLPDCSDDQLSKRLDKKLDLIVCAGILYHVLEPMRLLYNLRVNLKKEGLLILETQYMWRKNYPYMEFSPADNKNGSIHANTFFRPSLSSLIAMMEIVGFQVISTISVNSRLTVLAKAVKPSELVSTNKMTMNICKNYKNYKNYRDFIDYSYLEQDLDCSDIRYSQKVIGDYWIYSSKFTIENSLQPKYKPKKRFLIKQFLIDFKYKFFLMLARKKYIRNIALK
ncbi:class I SAM-dependent methyltransferase [Francisella uliginis]|uniref:Methyltransferase n=1 Tax=Francisella uliginis TaxID=573570 RepID=A0A1L4BSN5_9GAMM|nr:methyltransferase domain-containing protein [Francisella uliginis]API86859.1 hypothetical protein F7310_05595 [Francisella uliginis]